MKNIYLNSLKALLLLLMVGFGQNLNGQSNCVAPNQCFATPGFGDAPASQSCVAPSLPVAIFTETFDTGFGVFTEDPAPGGTNDLTLSTSGDTPSGSTGPETTASCNGGANEGEFIFLETSFGTNETHCMSTTIALPAAGGTANTPYTLSFWYYMFGGNIGDLEVFVNGTSSFLVSGQQQTVSCDAWLQGDIPLTALAGTSPTIQICMTETTGTSTFQGDIAIDHVQVFACAPVCEITCPATINLNSTPGICGAMADPMPMVNNACNNPIINDFTGTASAMALYPVGTTTVTFSTTDDFGNPLSCTSQVVVSDTEAPTFVDCPSDIIINLDPGACDQAVSYNASATDNCTTTTGSLATITAGGNGGGVGGTVYFNINNTTTNNIEITTFDMNITANTLVDVYTATTYIGNVNNAGAWTLAAQFDATNGAVSGPFPGNGTLTPALGSLIIPPGVTGIALNTLSAAHNYTNGTGANQTYSNGDLTLNLGAASNALFAGGNFNPRVFNGGVSYIINLDPVVTLNAGLPSGSNFPIGTTGISLTATDAVGNTSTCNFNVIVNEFVPSSNDITCNSLVHISLDENCQAIVGADQILEGNNYGCYNNFPVTFADGPNAGQPVVLGPGDVGNTYQVMVTNPAGNPCWGNILVEDKIAPIIVCQDVELECEDALPSTPAPGTTAPASLATLTDGGNGGAVGGMVYFNITNLTASPLEITSFDMNISANSLVDVYTSATYVGNETNAGAWTLAAQFDATAGAVSGPFPGNGTLTPALGTLVIQPGVTGIGLVTPNAAHNYTNGNGGNQSYADAFIQIDLGTGSNAPFQAGFNPRVWNGAVGYKAVVDPVATTDACGSVDLTFTDVVQDMGCNGAFSEIITRTWTATDGSGNTATCTSVYSRKRAVLADIEPELPQDITLECGSALPPPVTALANGCGNIGISLDGDPTIIDICGSGFKMLRTYTVIDWCTNTSIEHTQIIKVQDTEDPVLTCPADLTVSTTTNSCSGNVALIMPTWTDCGGGVTFSVSASAGTVSGNILSGLPVGEHTVTFTATDDCGNSADCTQKITVEDNVTPTAVCDEHTVVSLGSDGTAWVGAATFDDGSNDNCGIVSMEAQRMDNPNCPGFDGTSFGDYVPFYCCDIGSTVMVAFRVTDAAGNTNSCMVEVEVQDKMNPTIVCKPDLTIGCDNPIIADIQTGQPLPASALAITGTPVAFDNCDVTVSSNVILNTLDDCGNGEIKIAWSAVDGAGNFDGCFQSIFINDNNPFNGNSIVWPLDYTVNTCGTGLEPEDLNAPYNYPTWTGGTCSNVASTHEDTQLSFGADNACLKILRKWIIIDWCTVPAGADPTDPNTPGVWHYTQIIKVLNSTAPVIETFNGATTIDNFDANCGGVFVAFDITASDDCTPSNLLEYSWEFSTGTSGSGTSASAVFVNGTYSVTFTVSDQCGNTSTDSRTFTVADKKKPTPVCIFGIASTVMPSAQQVTIWASDFESGSSYDNCTAYNNLIFSFSPVVPGQPIDDNIVITCADVPSDGLVPVTLYVTDAAGNFDFCTTFINVQDPNGACPGPNTIFGTIATENAEVVEDVTVTLEDQNGPMVTPVVTGVDGTFSFNMPLGDYELVAEKDINYLNGVTTYDLVLISKHILGIEILDSPYKIIAADANHTETVTTLDIVKLRALILHIDDELANNTSWRFVDGNYTFNNPNNPLLESFPEYVELDPNLAIPSNFTGIKIGDVNGTASPNSLLGTETRTMDGKLALQAKATAVAAGETFTVDFTAKDFNNIAGYQFTLGFDNNAVEFVDVTSNLEGLTSNNFGLTKTGEGVITTSWNSSKGVSVENNEVLFSVTFVANADVNTQDVININSRYTESEAYNGSDLFDVVLEFNGTETANGFELYQNTPNPFKAETLIGFNLPEAGEVTLKVFDVSGRILRLVEMDAAKGYNSIDLNRAGLDATGVLYYQLETATETATKKMIIVD